VRRLGILGVGNTVYEAQGDLLRKERMHFRKPTTNPVILKAREEVDSMDNVACSKIIEMMVESAKKRKAEEESQE
jgi:hypothetical protein